MFHFAGVDSINDAEKYRGLEVLLPFEQRVTLPAGQYFVADLMGCAVFEMKEETAGGGFFSVRDGERAAIFGDVRDVQFPGEAEGMRGTPVLEVETAKGELLIPLAQDICRRIDTVARRIEVILPEGLRELNLE